MYVCICIYVEAHNFFPLPKTVYKLDKFKFRNKSRSYVVDGNMTKFQMEVKPYDGKYRILRNYHGKANWSLFKSPPILVYAEEAFLEMEGQIRIHR